MKISFKNKNVMIIVPHQDDELNICGGMISSNYFDNSKVKIVFSTNGDYLCNYKARVRETNKLIKKLKISNDNVIYLGYSDQHINEDNHVYLTHEPNVFVSKRGNNETFSNNFHYKKYKENAKFNHENFVNDITDVIVDNKPDVLFVIDFDSHPDHRALSLAFEESIGKILNNNPDYKPVIFKAFAYPTYYKGIRDFNNKKSQKTKFLTEPYSMHEMQNPYYNFNDRISFKVKNNRLLLFNKTYKLFRIYRSQMIIQRIYSILNDDLIFFRRRSDNLLNSSSIKVSSGNKDYLNDFMLFDVKNITHGNSEKVMLKNSALIFDKNDNKKEIEIKLNKKYNIKELVLYQNIYDNSRILEVQIKVNNEIIKSKISGNKHSVKLNCLANKIDIIVTKSIGENAGFSEIELFDNILENEKIDNVSNENNKESIVLKVINNITLCFDVFFARVLNKIDRILGRL